MMIKIFKITLALFLTLPLNLFAIDWQTFGLYRGTYHQYRETLFNPDGFTVDQLGFKKADYYFSQYLGLNGRFLSLDWQFDMLGTSAYDKNWNHNLRVKQLYFRKDFFQNWDIMVGRSILRWGTGYAFNPTDVVAVQKELSDPDNVEKRTPGTDLVKLEYFGANYSAAIVYFAKLKLDKKFALNDPRMAFRFYKNFWGLDLSLVSLLNQNERPIWGGNFSCVIGDRLEIHGEIASQKGSYQLYHRAIDNPNTFYTEDPLQPLKKNDHRFFNQYLVGFNYTFPKNINWILEYYHQDQGYSRAEWQRVIDHVKFVSNYFDTPFGELAKGNLLWSLNVFSSKGAMRDYFMNYVNVPILKNLEFKSTVLTNLNDGSMVIIPQIDFTLKNSFTFYGRSFIFEGKKTSEFGELFRSFSIEGGLRFVL